jgi:Na+-driven multidrug efflux pump
MTVLFIVLFFHGAVLYPEQLVEMINPEPAYIEKSAEILRFIAGSIMIFGLFNVYFHTINGSGNTAVTFTIEVISVGIYILAAYLLIKVFEFDIFWIWSVEYFYFAFLGLLSLLYLRLFDWKTKKI